MRILSVTKSKKWCGQDDCTAQHYKAKIFLEEEEVARVQSGDSDWLQAELAPTLWGHAPANAVVDVNFAMKCPCCDDVADITQGLRAEVTMPDNVTPDAPAKAARHLKRAPVPR